MAAGFAPSPVVTDEDVASSEADDLWHIFCGCDGHEISLCGARNRRRGARSLESTDPGDCVVCEDLNDLPCPRCGF